MKHETHPDLAPAPTTEVSREMFRDLALVEDRKRIAADLHDTVVQRLFAAGLELQGALRNNPPSDIANRIEAAIVVMDQAIGQIRSTIFALEVPDYALSGVRAQILAVTTEAATSLGFMPHLRLEGPLDATVSRDVGGHLVAVLREALSNVARHARASHAETTVAITGGHLLAEVRDDGIGPGIGSRAGGRGMTNLSHRAACLGGTMSLASGTDGRGSVFTWRVPVRTVSTPR